MKQKLFALLLAVALVLSLAACTASPSDSGSNTSASQAPAADVPDFTDVDTSTIPGLEDGVLTVGFLLLFFKTDQYGAFGIHFKG